MLQKKPHKRGSRGGRKRNKVLGKSCIVEKAAEEVQVAEEAFEVGDSAATPSEPRGARNEAEMESASEAEGHPKPKDRVLRMKRKWSEKGVSAAASPLKRVKSSEETKGRPWTVSIAVPGSIMKNAQSPELRTYLAGQIARVAAVFCVDEVIVFTEDGSVPTEEKEFRGARRRGADPNIFLARILQYLETPQFVVCPARRLAEARLRYLRKRMFPVHKDLRYAGLLNPLDAPHHVRADENVPFREGVTLGGGKGKGCLVDIGLKQPVRLPHNLRPGVRVTVEIENPLGSSKRKREWCPVLLFEGRTGVRGSAVSPSLPREREGLYWGYQVRLAAGLNEVLEKCPFADKYDVTVGTSERGTNALEDSFHLLPFRHLLIVFGGVQGLETCLEQDASLQVSNPAQLFDMYVNTCPNQGSRTIRTEEAVTISLTVLQKHVLQNSLQFLKRTA